MKDNWLWDRKISDAKAKKILKKSRTEDFFAMAALLLSRKNEPDEVFKSYLDPLVFCRYWSAIKRKMRQDKWGEGRIIFWDAIYEKLIDKYRKKGVVFRQKPPAREPFCEAIGRKIAAIRREQGLSQKDMAKKMGISQQLISRVEKGGGNISLLTLTNLAAALDKKVMIDFV
jgi:DNA-binding XRE family transcriptional regulator